MTHKLSKREVLALEKAQIENDHLQGDFCLKAKLGPGIGAGTIENLVALGLLEIGYSSYHREENCVRLTADGERCLNGGLTTDEILQKCPSGKMYHAPRNKHWPVIEKGEFR